MEVRTTGQMRRNERLDKQLAKKTEAKQAAPTAKTPTPDRCTLSRQALAYLERQNALRQELEERRAREKSRIDGALGEAESKKKQLDMMEKALDVMRKCMKIAASIMKGNRVPPEDLEYLMKNDPEGYKMALALRRHNPDPKDEKSVLDDEDRNGGRVDGSDAAQSAPTPEVSAPEASEDVE